MKVQALSDVASEIPDSELIIEHKDGQRLTVTGFQIHVDKDNHPIIVVKSGRPFTK